MFKLTFWEAFGLSLELLSSNLPAEIWEMILLGIYYWVDHLPEHIWLITNLPFG